MSCILKQYKVTECFPLEDNVYEKMLQGKQENVPPPRPSVKERLGVPNPVCNNKVLNTLQPKASLALQSEAVEKVHTTVIHCLFCKVYNMIIIMQHYVDEYR